MTDDNFPANHRFLHASNADVFRQMSVEDNIAAVLEMTNKPKEYQKENDCNTN